MFQRFLSAMALAMAIASPVSAQTMGQATTLFDLRGQPFGTPASNAAVMVIAREPTQ